MKNTTQFPDALSPEDVIEFICLPNHKLFASYTDINSEKGYDDKYLEMEASDGIGVQFLIRYGKKANQNDFNLMNVERLDSDKLGKKWVSVFNASIG